MTAPVDLLLESIANLLLEGRNGVPAVFPQSGGIPIYKTDVPVTVDPPFIIVAHEGAAKERHAQGSGLWEIPISVWLVVDRNGELGQSTDDIAEAIRDKAKDMQAVLTLPLLEDEDEPEGDYTTPEQRLCDGSIHVWEISDVEVENDVEDQGNPTCEIKFTVFCTHASRIIS